MAARNPGSEKQAYFSPPGSRAAFFFLAGFFRVSLDGLREGGTSRSLEFTPFTRPLKPVKVIVALLIYSD